MFSSQIFHVVIERLMQVLESNSERALAIELGLKPAAYYNRKRTLSLPLLEIVTMCLSRNVSIDWLFTGIGEAFMSGEKIGPTPIAAIDTALLGVVAMELEKAFVQGTPDGKERIKHATELGLLAGALYNRVAFVKNEKVRRSLIRDEANWAAVVERVSRGGDQKVDIRGAE